MAGHLPPSSSSRCLTADNTRRWSTFWTALTVASLSSAVLSPLASSCLRALSVPDRLRCSRFSRASRPSVSSFPLSFLSSGIPASRARLLSHVPVNGPVTFPIVRTSFPATPSCKPHSELSSPFCAVIPGQGDAISASSWRKISIFVQPDFAVHIYLRILVFPPPRFLNKAMEFLLLTRRAASVHFGGCVQSPKRTRPFYLSMSPDFGKSLLPSPNWTRP